MSCRLHKSAIAALIAILSMTGCGRPDGNELFIRRDEAREGVYIFKLPLTDSLASYDFWFYSRAAREPVSDLELKVLWLDPSGESLSETVYMRHVGTEGTKELYRSGMVPLRRGEWQLSVKPEGDVSELLGLGLEYRINDGTR